MRITNNMLVMNMMNNLGRNLNRMQKLQDQFSSGKKFQLPSDDPIGVAKSLKLHTDLSKIEQYKSNINDAKSWLETTETAIDEMNSVFKRARELMVQSSNGTQTPEDMQKTASEMEQLKKHIIKLANTTYAGRSIFTGYKTDGKLMDEDGYYMLTSHDVVDTAGGESLSATSEATALKIEDITKLKFDGKTATYEGKTIDLEDLKFGKIAEKLTDKINVRDIKFGSQMSTKKGTAVTFPLDLSGPNLLKFNVSGNNIPYTMTLNGVYNDIDELTKALDDQMLNSGVTVTNDGNSLVMRTTGSSGVSITDIAFGNIANIGLDANPAPLADNTLKFKVKVDGVESEVTLDKDFGSIYELSQEIQNQILPTGLKVSTTNGQLKLYIEGKDNFEIEEVQGDLSILKLQGGTIGSSENTLKFDVQVGGATDTVTIDKFYTNLNDLAADITSQLGATGAKVEAFDGRLKFTSDNDSDLVIKAPTEGTFDKIGIEATTATAKTNALKFDLVLGSKSDTIEIDGTYATVQELADDIKTQIVNTGIEPKVVDGKLQFDFDSSSDLEIKNIVSGKILDIGLTSDRFNGSLKVKDLNIKEISRYNVGVSADVDINVVGVNLFGVVDTSGNPSYTKEVTGYNIGLNSLGQDRSEKTADTDKAYVIDFFDEVVASLNAGDTSKVQTYMEKIDKISAQNLSTRASIGARVKRLELNEDRIESQKINFTKLLSENEDADMAEVIMQTKIEENVYRASLSSGARIIQPSLLDFLR